MASFPDRIAELRHPSGWFSPRAPIFYSRAPGRLDLMGGNDDYTGGLVFETTIREATWAAVQLRTDRTVAFWNPQMAKHGWSEKPGFSLEDLTTDAAVRKLVNRAPATRWTAYVLGCFYWLRRRFPDRVRTGARIFIQSDVPLNKGVSSSASVEVAVMKSTAAAYGIDLSGISLAEACQWVENVVAESACGIMDQITVVLGDEGYFLPLVCQTCRPQPLVHLPVGLTYWGIDSGVSHMVSGFEYEAARAAAFMGYKLICDWEQLDVQRDGTNQIVRWTDPRWNGYLANVSVAWFRSRCEPRLPESLAGSHYLTNGQVHVDPFTTVRPEAPYHVRANTRYAIEENFRVHLFSELVRAATGFELMGELMYQSHQAYTDCGLGCEATDQLVELVRDEGVANGLYGAKITGGGAGGTVAVLGRPDARPALDRVVQRYADARGFRPYIFEGSSVGADRFGVQLIEPAA